MVYPNDQLGNSVDDCSRGEQNEEKNYGFFARMPDLETAGNFKSGKFAHVAPVTAKTPWK